MLYIFNFVFFKTNIYIVHINICNFVFFKTNMYIVHINIFNFVIFKTDYNNFLCSIKDLMYILEHDTIASAS